LEAFVNEVCGDWQCRFYRSHLSDALVKKGDVGVFDNFSSGKKDFLKGVDVDIIQGDIRNLDEIKEACKEVDVVYHYAADPDIRRSFSRPLENFGIDVLGTLNVLEACRLNDAKQIVLASSSVVYGNAKIRPPKKHQLLLSAIMAQLRLLANIMSPLILNFTA
jgi:UDP-glucose 4-epimerase